MLILQRKEDEEIIIGREGTAEIVIKVLQLKGGQVYIGIDAPREFSVHRKEVFERCQADKLKGIIYKKKEKKEVPVDK